MLAVVVSDKRTASADAGKMDTSFRHRGIEIRALPAQLFDRVWNDGKRIVAVRLTAAFADLFVPETRTPPLRRMRRC